MDLKYFEKINPNHLPSSILDYVNGGRYVFDFSPSSYM